MPAGVFFLESSMSLWELRLSCRQWDPLRSDPRFKKILSPRPSRRRFFSPSRSEVSNLLRRTFSPLCGRLDCVMRLSLCSRGFEKYRRHFPLSRGSLYDYPLECGGRYSVTHSTIAPEKTRIAFARLCEDYWPPLYRFVRQRGYSRHDAQDLPKVFRLSARETGLWNPHRSEGRFRTFLLALLKRYWVRPGLTGATKARRQSRDVLSRRRRIEVLDKAGLEALSSDSPPDEERLFEWNWAMALVSRAMAKLSADIRATQSPESWLNCDRF